MSIFAFARNGFRLDSLLDYFIPAELQVNAESHRRARMFMLSHVFGPILGNSIPLYMAVMGISRDYRVVVFFLSILTFWIYPFLLRKTGRYQLIAFVSVQNLIFCALWACYSYGGMASPFLPWILIFPLLAFLYLPPKGWVRNVLLAQIFGSVGSFIALNFSGWPLPDVNLKHLQTIGMISMASVAIYFAMMSLYFAKMFHEQREFTRELNALVSTSDNLRNLTAAAYQASAAKADFVAGMSHELRTPLNAIIGYSQLLLEEARDEDDSTVVADLGHVHRAGSDLLRLIDDILAYSRIDAGKMPLNPDFADANEFVSQWIREVEETCSAKDYEIELSLEPDRKCEMLTDWNAVGSTVKRLTAGIVNQNRKGKLTIALGVRDDILAVTFVDRDESGAPRPIMIVSEMFEHEDDSSPTKYGATGIEIAVAFKLAQLLGGSIRQTTLPGGEPAAELQIPQTSNTSGAIAA